MNIAIQTCITALEAQRTRIEQALDGLRAIMSADEPTLSEKCEKQEVPPAPPQKAATTATTQKPATAKKSTPVASQPAPAATVVSPAHRRHQDAALAALASASEPMASSQIAKATARSQTAVNTVLPQLERAGRVFRTGRGVATRWAIRGATPVQPSTTSAPRTGTTRVNGVEFETVFDGSRGQSLTGDRDTKGRLGVGNV